MDIQRVRDKARSARDVVRVVATFYRYLFRAVDCRVEKQEKYVIAAVLVLLVRDGVRRRLEMMHIKKPTMINVFEELSILDGIMASFQS